MSASYILYYGKEEPPPERIPLRAGPLTLFYEQGDLRYIKMGDLEILRRIYVAIRDRNWGTILPRISHLHMDIRADSFYISYEVENTRGEINFTWQGEIAGDPQGKISFSMRGQARSTFLRNRIGFCVLHPSTCAGALAQVEHVDGQIEDGIFPEIISASQPVLPFAELRGLAHQVTPEVWAKLTFQGDIFEMEDQRNWTDASYKTYCTPLRLPYPAQIEAGTRVDQSITLTLVPELPTSTAGFQDQGSAQPVTFRLRTGSAGPLPRIGLGVASHGQPLSAQEITHLKVLHLNHLRVDLRLSQDNFLETLEQAAEQAKTLGVSLEAAVIVGEQPEAAFARLRKTVTHTQPPIKTWLIFPERESFSGGSPTRQAVETARRYLTELSPGAWFAAGTNTDLIFMQRTPPPLELLDSVTFAINPQVHAFDNASIVETLKAQGAAVRTAQHLAGGKPVMVSPLTFKPTHNAYATTIAPALSPGELPPQVDPRQMSLLGAGWTAGSLKYLAENGLASVTYFETTGWRGVMETDQGSGLPGLFHSRPGSVFPIYHVLADFGEFASGEVIASRSSNPLVVDGLCLRKDSRIRLLLMSFSIEPQLVTIFGLDGMYWVKAIDGTTAEEAMLNPEAFRENPGALVLAANNTLQITLLPYAVVRIDG